MIFADLAPGPARLVVTAPDGRRCQDGGEVEVVGGELTQPPLACAPP